MGANSLVFHGLPLATSDHYVNSSVILCNLWAVWFPEADCLEENKVWQGNFFIALKEIFHSRAAEACIISVLSWFQLLQMLGPGFWILFCSPLPNIYCFHVLCQVFSLTTVQWLYFTPDLHRALVLTEIET